MSTNGGSSDVAISEVGIRCEEYPDGCGFAMQFGVFDDAINLETLVPSLDTGSDCPSCGQGLERWDLEFASSAPGRPSDW